MRLDAMAGRVCAVSLSRGRSQDMHLCTAADAWVAAHGQSSKQYRAEGLHDIADEDRLGGGGQGLHGLMRLCLK